jgi:hypothetical protein
VTDAERLTRGFISSIRESPFRIAPERVQALIAQMGGSAWPLDIVEGPANFTAFPKHQGDRGNLRGLAEPLGRSRLRPHPTGPNADGRPYGR